jgi:hypothetical protein
VNTSFDLSTLAGQMEYCRRTGATWSETFCPRTWPADHPHIPALAAAYRKVMPA